MKSNLAENIRNHRKARSLTQEQLAEALGVTTGAVYKWESEKSVPEVSMLMELADFFDTSIDVLLGFELRNNDKKSTIERLKKYMHSRGNDDALSDVDKVLQKYPNCFEIVYRCAKVYQVRGWDLRDKKLLERATELYERAILLLDQNTDSEISLLSIQRETAELYANIGMEDKAIDIWKQNNPNRINHALIGNVLASHYKKSDEAEKYLSMALLDTGVSLITISSGFINVYVERGEYQNAIDICLWMISATRGLKISNKTNFLEKIEALYLAICGAMYLRLGENELAEKYMLEAKMVAEQFDAAPDYNPQNLKFIIPDETGFAHDNTGETAMEAIENFIEEEKEHTELVELWKKVKNN